MSHVLIVDDEESICWGLERLLTETGHEVSVAASAEEAFESVDRDDPTWSCSTFACRAWTACRPCGI